MLNKVVLIGRLTKDPELKYLPSGIAVASFTLAVNRNFTNQQGEREADFIPIVVWRGQAENCSKYISKGRLVAVSGRIQTRNYEVQGQRRYITEVVADEVVFLDRGEMGSTGRGQSAQDFNQSGYNDDPGVDFNPLPMGEDDELPF